MKAHIKNKAAKNITEDELLELRREEATLSEAVAHYRTEQAKIGAQIEE